MPRLLSLVMPLHRAVEFDYPFREVVRSVVGLCDEAVLVVSPYPDGTLEACRKLRGEWPGESLRIIERDWWSEARGCECLASATNIAIEASTGRYVLNLQADEVLHEEDRVEVLRLANGTNLWAELGRLNFFGRFDAYNATVTRWPCSVVRLMRRDLYPTVRSYGDATHLGWMENFDERRHPRVDARGTVDLWHYAYTRPAQAFMDRQASMAKLYGLPPDGAIEAFRGQNRLDWWSIVPKDEFLPLPRPHPLVMQKWIADRREWVESGSLVAKGR